MAVMGDLLDALPIAAAAFAIPQFLPQLRKLRRTDDTAGVSWPWATLTSVNNAAWLGYFAASAYWAALVPASSATLLAGALAVMLARRGRCSRRPSSFRSPRRSGPPTEPLAPPGSRREPGSSSSASCPAGRSSGSTSPTRA
jgi:hypothetical protein